VLADAFAPPFQERSFDLIRLKELIEHVEDPRSLVESATRLMRKDGILLAHVPSSWSQLYPAGNFWDDYTHVRPFSRLGLVRLMEDSGLRVLRINGYVLGRNAIESAIGKALAYILPHTYRVIAEMPFDS
jgi:SAM-dependent methyltransferase